jgi:hypothetical protein
MHCTISQDVGVGDGAGPGWYSPSVAKSKRRPVALALGAMKRVSPAPLGTIWQSMARMAAETARKVRDLGDQAET